MGSMKKLFSAVAVVAIIWFGLTGCTTQRYIQEQIAQAVDTKTKEAQSQIEVNKMEIARLKEAAADQNDLVHKVSDTTVEALEEEADPQSGATGIGPEYVLGPEDLMEISVWKNVNLTKEIVVLPDGKISFPLIGDIHASGLTVQQLRNKIAERISEFTPDPTVTVLVLQVNSNKLYVVGEVKRPGEYTTGHRTDVMQVLSMAGGFTTFASPRKIVILRRQNGVMKKIAFNYNQVVQGKHLEQNIILQRGDVIVVP